MSSLTLALPTRLPERRRRRRQKVWLRGELAAGGRTLATCRVMDLDAVGAQVRLDGRCLLPAEFDLLLPATGSRRPAGILWRQGVLVGLRFDPPPSIGLS